MTIISLIAAIDEMNGIGTNNKLLCYLPADLHHFKKITMGKPIIMGRKTYESIGKPLAGRINIVVSRTLKSIPGVIIVTSLEQGIIEAGNVEEIMVIGGEQIFTESIGKATRLYITKIHSTFAADVFFPKIDESIWSAKKNQFRSHDELNRYDLTFYLYEHFENKNSAQS